jgi:hypothetical protein
MMLVYMSYLIYQAGDENFVVDSTVLQQTTGIMSPDDASKVVSGVQLYDAAPNPANSQTSISYYLPAAAKVELAIFSLEGKLVEEIDAGGNAGLNAVAYNTSRLQAGTYLISLRSGNNLKSKQLVVTNR